MSLLEPSLPAWVNLDNYAPLDAMAWQVHAAEAFETKSSAAGATLRYHLGARGLTFWVNL